MAMDAETAAPYDDEPLFTSVATKSGSVTLRDGKNKISYEIHGSGPQKIFLIMGLLSSKYSWRDTLSHFTEKNSSEYSICVYDNRGVGQSSAPWGRYTTAMLAADALDLLDHLEWTEERSVHVNGISMGGMISLELALLAGSRIKSLTLTSTCAKHQNPPRTRAESAMNWVNFFRPKTTTDAKVTNLMDSLFVDENWLREKNAAGITNRDRVYRNLFIRIQRQPSPALAGQMGQIAACLTHNCSYHSLLKIGEIIPDILIITGDRDKLIDPKCSAELYSEMSQRGSRKSIRKVVMANKGHALPAEADQQYHAEFEKTMEAGNTRWQ